MKNLLSNIGDSGCNRRLYKNGKKSSKFAPTPIAITQGQCNSNSFPVPEGLKSFQMESVCLFAFFYVYMEHPLKWTPQIVNNIIQQGTEFVMSYVDLKESVITNCTIFAQNYTGRIQIQEPSIVDTMISKTPILTNLQIFFQKNDYGLFRSSELCCLMWKSNEAYFIFDSQGGTNRCLEPNNGLASLTCTESLQNVSKLVQMISGLGQDDCYSISAITMQYFGADASGCTKLQFKFTNSDAYTVLSTYWAILRGQIHIGSSGFKSTRNRQSMTVGLIALICKEIQCSNSWTSEFVDKIILLGTQLFHEYATLGEINIKHLPREYSIHEYRCTIDYRPNEYSGKITDSNTNLFAKLRQAFEGSSKLIHQSSVLLQVNSLVFPIWLNNGFYYLFDAYARNERGWIPYDKFGKSCLHMHSTLQSLWHVLRKNLTIIARHEKFVLHGISVMLECKCEEKVHQNDTVLLNEFINDLCWPEMDYFQETSSSKDYAICNLDESSDDESSDDQSSDGDFFNETINHNEIPSTLSEISTCSASVSTNESETGGYGNYYLFDIPDRLGNELEKTVKPFDVEPKNFEDVEREDGLKKITEFEQLYELQRNSEDRWNECDEMTAVKDERMDLLTEPEKIPSDELKKSEQEKREDGSDGMTPLKNQSMDLLTQPEKTSQDEPKKSEQVKREDEFNKSDEMMLVKDLPGNKLTQPEKTSQDERKKSEQVKHEDVFNRSDEMTTVKDLPGNKLTQPEKVHHQYELEKSDQVKCEDGFYKSDEMTPEKDLHENKLTEPHATSA